MERKILNIDGVTVSETSSGRIVLLDEKNIEGCHEVLKQQNPKMLSVFTTGLFPGYNRENFDAIRHFGLEMDLIIVTSGNIKDWSSLYDFKSIKALRINWLDKVVLDFSRIGGLSELEVDWNNKQTNLFTRRGLTKLKLWKYKTKKENLEEFKRLLSLEELGLFQSNIHSLKGIETLPNLKRLNLGYNRNLEIRMDEFEKPFYQIEELEIEGCKKVNLDFVRLFPNLKKLTLVKQPAIASLRPILDGLRDLEEIFIGETKIEESDNLYYKDYDHIRAFFFMQMRHHKLKMYELGKWD